MTLFHRRLLYSLFFLVFFITAPLIIIWAQGYKFDWQHKTWQKTGVLFLESKPDNAQIILNGVLLKDQTTARIKNLLPGDYQVTVQKDGYLSWQKDLKIFPSETTFAQYIRLFRADPPTQTILQKPIDIFSNTAKNKIAFTIINQTRVKNETQTIYLLNADNGQLTNKTMGTVAIDQIILNTDGDQALIKNHDGSWQFVDFLADQTTNLNTLTSTHYQKILFDPQNQLTFFGLSVNGIDKISIPGSAVIKLITANDITDFFADTNNLIYYLKINKNDAELRFINTQIPLQDNKSDSLPWSDSYHFFASPANIINLIDEKNQLLYLYDFNQTILKDTKTILPNVNFISWGPDNKSFLFGNEYEIYLWDNTQTDAPKQLITRLGTKINDLIWYSVPTHILYLTEHGLTINELIMINYRRETTEFAKFKNATKLLINSKGDKLYWFEPLLGVFSSEIQ